MSDLASSIKNGQTYREWAYLAGDLRDFLAERSAQPQEALFIPSFSLRSSTGLAFDCVSTSPYGTVLESLSCIWPTSRTFAWVG
jgi:hypothetical protein